MSFKQFKMNQMAVDAIIRNLITHEYFGIDYEMIWKIAKTNLPVNKLDLEKSSETGKSLS